MYTTFQKAMSYIEKPEFIKYGLIGQELFNLEILINDNYNYGSNDPMSIEVKIRDAFREDIQ